jgi:hypothetical protein
MFDYYTYECTYSCAYTWICKSETSSLQPGLHIFQNNFFLVDWLKKLPNMFYNGFIFPFLCSIYRHFIELLPSWRLKDRSYCLAKENVNTSGKERKLQEKWVVYSKMSSNLADWSTARKLNGLVSFWPEALNEKRQVIPLVTTVPASWRRRRGTVRGAGS